MQYAALIAPYVPGVRRAMTEIALPAPRRARRRARQRTGLDFWGRVVVVAGVAVAVYLIAAPLAMLLVTAFRGPAEFLPFEPGARWTLANVIQVYADPALYGRVIPDTLVFVAGSVGLSFSIGFALAWLIERTDLPGREAWFTLILFPLLVPTIVLGIAWVFLMGPKAGWLNLGLRSLLGHGGEGPINVFTMGGLIVCQALASVPFVFILLTAALRTMNPTLEEASAASGASPVTTFRRVTVPVLLPGILAPFMLVCLVTLEQFELPSIIGVPAKVSIFSYRILYELNPADGLPNYGAAAAVALPFLALGIVLLALYNLAIRRADRFVTVTGKAYVQRRLPLGRWRVPALMFVGAYVVIGALLPAAILVWASLLGYVPPSLSALREASFAAYGRLFSDPIFWLAVRNTLFVAGASALVISLLGGLVGWTLLRLRFPGRTLLDFFSFMSIGIPSVIAGLAVMLLYLTVPIGIYGTVAILIVAYSYRLAVSTRLAKAGLMQLHRELEEASVASGARWMSTQGRIVLPLLRAPLFSSFVLLFIVGVREFTLPLILHSQDNVVLSVLLWKLFQNGDAPQAAALATVIVLLVVPVVAMARRALMRAGG
ncbi:MAG TPA: iron ABC transporter permease [Hyphomicrobiaceae bacterium]